MSGRVVSADALGVNSEAPFGAMLREKLAELDADEAREAWLERDPLERFCLATQQAALAEQGGPAPRPGHHAYTTKPPEDLAPGKRTLDIVK